MNLKQKIGEKWRENEARVMRVDGRMMLAMTWPDDPSINVDWLYNEVYEPIRYCHVQGFETSNSWPKETA